MGGVTLTPQQIAAGMGTKGVPFITRAKAICIIKS